MTPDPLKFVQMNSRYWEVWHDPTVAGDEIVPNWTKLGYQVPDGCTLEECEDTENIVNGTDTRICQVRKLGITYHNCNIKNTYLIELLKIF